MRSPHVLKVSREVDINRSDRRKQRGLEVVHPKLRGLVEPRRSKESSTRLGQLSQNEFLLTWWGGEELRAGDEIEWSGATFTVGGLVDDRYRATSRISGYQVCELVQKL